MQYCPCGSKKNYQACCELYLSGQETPEHPEKLMRSRYTACTQANISYILKTMKSPAADNVDAESAKKWAASVKWLRLKILMSSINQDKGYVEFIARFIENGKANAIHEISEFHKIDSQWYYVDGKMPL